MTFRPRDHILTLEEIAILADRFIARGVRKIRLSGGERLVRRDLGELVRGIGRHLKSGTLQELTLTTNGTQLAHHAEMLADAGVRRINVSLDTLDPDLFTRITRRGHIDRSEEHTSELQSLMRISYAVFCLNKKNPPTHSAPSH